MKLKDLMVDTKTAWLDFPGAPGFEVQVANLSRKELVALRKRCIQQKFDRKTRQMVTKDTVKNWRGLKLKYLEDLLLVDLKGQDLEAKLDYDEEQAQVLVQNSTEFDNWINEVVFDLANFRRAGAGEPLDALRGVANS
jgi:hypothetical protein